MPETIQTDYQAIPDMDVATVSGERFFVQVAGKTNGAHLEYVERLRGIGQTEVSSPEQCDYIVVFCPIVSRVGKDIGEALENIPGGKKTILVVMHHTFDPNYVVAESRRQVANPNVCLTVDCLFYEGKLLRCDRNDIAWYEIQKAFGVPASQVSMWNALRKLSGERFFVQVAGKTNGAHLEYIERLRGIGQTEVSSPEQCDYVMVFCPIVSRVGKDIGEALENIPGGKKTILVVMHHTFDPNYVVAGSRRQVANPNVCLTVDCLFYEGKLLKSNRNDIAWYEIQKAFGVPASQG
ncbi:uncharacterized protein [Pagrus major]|uniref:uncharacterized protein n=1 Tax=Pagrus major TaxID=143350 RepID=UPI003CC86A47